MVFRKMLCKALSMRDSIEMSNNWYHIDIDRDGVYDNCMKERRDVNNFDELVACVIDKYGIKPLGVYDELTRRESGNYYNQVSKYLKKVGVKRDRYERLIDNVLGVLGRDEVVDVRGLLTKREDSVGLFENVYISVEKRRCESVDKMYNGYVLIVEGEIIKEYATIDRFDIEEILDIFLNIKEWRVIISNDDRIR